MFRTVFCESKINPFVLMAAAGDYFNNSNCYNNNIRVVKIS
jgi:hypothetical protein